MMNDTAVRKDLERVARNILAEKTWSIKIAAQFLGYSKSQMYAKAQKENWYVQLRGGCQHVYAIDVLEKYQELCSQEFPELAREWYKTYKITPPQKFSSVNSA